MKRWSLWLILAAIWLPSAAVNRADGNSAGFVTNLVQISLFLLAALVQYRCDKNGKQGKKVFRLFAVCAVALCIASCLAALLLKR